jgi:hypothetical protein
MDFFMNNFDILKIIELINFIKKDFKLVKMSFFNLKN